MSWPSPPHRYPLMEDLGPSWHLPGVLTLSSSPAPRPPFFSSGEEGCCCWGSYLAELCWGFPRRLFPARGGGGRMGKHMIWRGWQAPRIQWETAGGRTLLAEEGSLECDF